MRIESVTISGFRSFGLKPVTVDFAEDLTTIVGPNASGKTALFTRFIEVIRRHQDSADGTKIGAVRLAASRRANVSHRLIMTERAVLAAIFRSWSPGDEVKPKAVLPQQQSAIEPADLRTGRRRSAICIKILTAQSR